MNRQGSLLSIPCCGLWLAILLGVAGCSTGPTAIVPATYHPEQVAQLALEDYDRNKDGMLDSEELARCPALLSSLKELDRNRDGKLDAEEIADRVREYQEKNAGANMVACRVVDGDQPLRGATVTFVPERFMGTSLLPASGVSGDEGRVVLQMADVPVPGVRFGFYRIEVSLKNSAGQETIPARYNTQTVLGREVSPNLRNAIIVRID